MCLLLFLATVFTMVGLTANGLYNGNVMKLIGSVDGNHHICGGSDGYKDYPYLYITDLTQNAGEAVEAIFNTGVCVKKCPVAGDTIDCMTTTTV